MSNQVGPGRVNDRDPVSQHGVNMPTNETPRTTAASLAALALHLAAARADVAAIRASVLR